MSGRFGFCDSFLHSYIFMGKEKEEGGKEDEEESVQDQDQEHVQEKEKS